MGWLIACWRRFFGGYDAKINFLENRGVQCIFLIALIFLWEFFYKGLAWYMALGIGLAVYIFFSKSHWYYFKCGTEDDAYIDEEMSKGRKPAMNWLVAPVNKWLGFKERSKQYCFVGLMIRYFVWSLPVSALLQSWGFSVVAFTIPFIYNACFWVDFPKCKFAGSPTNWAEIYAGLAIGWALI